MYVPQQQTTGRGGWLHWYAPLAALTAFAAVELALPGFSDAWSGWPLLLSLVLVGMPHGAADLTVNSHLTGARTAPESLRRFIPYAAILAASLILFLVAPAAALMLFLILSGVHFGLADARDLRRKQRHDTSPWLAWTAAAGRGGLLLSLPLVASPVASVEVLSDVVGVAGGQLTFDVSAAAAAGAAVLCVAAALSAAALLWQLSAGNAAAAGWGLVEAAAIVWAFSLLHPLFAVGLYLVAWHGWRHMLWLSGILPSSATDGGPSTVASRVLKLHLQSLPLLAPTLGSLLLVAWWRLDQWTSPSLAAVTIAAFVVVTLPHHLLVERLARRESPAHLPAGANFAAGPPQSLTDSCLPAATVSLRRGADLRRRSFIVRVAFRLEANQ